MIGVWPVAADRSAKRRRFVAAVVVVFVSEAFHAAEWEQADGDWHAGHAAATVADADGASADNSQVAHKRKHLGKVVEWFHDVLLKRPPWSTWTNDIYDAMRCIDHLPIG